jgi:hypothetical protein
MPFVNKRRSMVFCLKTMVGATDTIFCAALTMVSDVATMVFFT